MSNLTTRFVNYVRHAELNGFWISLYCKALYGFLGLKLIALSPVIEDVSRYAPFTFGSLKRYLLYAPLALARPDLNWFVYALALLIVVGLWVRTNYMTGFLIFWFSLSLSRLCLPVQNGSDVVLNLFLFLGIFMPGNPSLRSGWSDYQLIISRFVILVAMIQLSLIYFISGLDKLLSAGWRSGNAIDSIANLTFYFNPLVDIEMSSGLRMVLCWTVIAFELTFALLIWFRRARKTLIIIGVIFHLLIIALLGLVDFGLVMIVTYSIYFTITPATSNQQPATSNQ
ncbi:MAG: HTTM domain-containing protein [Cyclobacteriaceae bacterium]